MSVRFDKKRWLGLILIGAAVIAIIYFWPQLRELFGSEEAVERTVESWGVYGPLVFLALNVLQVILAPAPGTAVGVAGGYLFGLWGGFLLNILGIFLGSLIAFGLARVYGRPLVERFVSERTRSFLERAAERNGVRGLFLMFLLPFLPDDALCLIAGLTPISWKTFMLIVILGRSPGSFVAAMTGSGLVDLPWWGWGIVAVVAIAFVLFWWRYGEALEERMRTLFVRGGVDRERHQLDAEPDSQLEHRPKPQS